MKKIINYLFASLLLPYLANAQCATSSAPTNNCGFGDQINSFALNGIPATGNSGCGASGYNSFSSPVWTLQIGSSYNWTATVGSGLYNEGVGIWIDLNNNGFYETTEFVGSSPAALTHNSTLNIPVCSVVNTNLRMRVRCAWNAAVTSGQVCTNSIGSGYGETEDYYVYLTCPSITPNLTVTASSSSVCSANNSVILTASGLCTYTWTGGITNGVTFNPTSTSSYTVTAGISGCPSNTATASRTITVSTTPTITGISSGSICPGASFIMTPGGASTYTYSSGSSSLTGSSANVSPIVTTSYSVSGTASNGCISSLSSSGYATVTTLASPAITLSTSSPSVCPGVSTTITAAGANTYTWTSPSSNSGTITVNPSASTIYTVSGTGTNVCNGIKTITISVYPTPTITVNSNTICAGKIFTMTPSGAATYSYANGSNTITAVTNTAINVIGYSSNNCPSAPAAANITVIPLPVVIVNSSTVCSGAQFVLSPTGATSYTFLNSSNPITPTVSGTYSVVGSTTVGCTSLPAVSNITVLPLPTISVAATPTDMIVCDTYPISLTASGASTYTWNNTSSGATYSATPLTNGSYFVVGTDINGCTSFATIPYTVNPLPQLSLTGNTFVCVGNSATLNAAGASTYSWTTGGSLNSEVVSPTVSTVYGVTGTNTLGCYKTLTLAVQVNSIVIVESPDTAICLGEGIVVSAVGAANYTWAPVGSPFSSIPLTPLVTTTYTYHAVDSKQCPHDGMITVTVNPIPVVTASGSSTLICAKESVTLTAGGANTYIWSALTVSVGTGSSFVVTPNNSTTYMVTGTDANGCISDTTVFISVDKCTGIPSNGNGEVTGIRIFPNPTHGEFTIDLNNVSVKTIEITDVAGRLILSIQPGEINRGINLTDMANGIYYVKIKSDKLSEVIKLIKD